jgi:hypothetical protein
MQIVEQLEGQLAKEQSRLEAMLAHLQQLQQRASKPEPGTNKVELQELYNRERRTSKTEEGLITGSQQTSRLVLL